MVDADAWRRVMRRDMIEIGRPAAAARKYPSHQSRRQTNLWRESTSPARGRKLQRSGDGDAAQFRSPPTGETRCGVSVAGLYHPLAVRYRGKEQECERERSCADPRMPRFGVCATRVRDQGQRQFQRPAHLPRTGTALLRQDPDQRSRENAGSAGSKKPSLPVGEKAKV
jgi:hypothetical protein